MMMNMEEIENTYQEMTSIEGIKNYDRPLLLQIALFQEYKKITYEEEKRIIRSR